MKQEEETRLLEEYRANVELWKHDDEVRQKRVGNFLTVNSILLVALVALANIKVSFLVLSLGGLLFSIFGFIICLIWHFVQVRNAEYVRFRRFQLRSIEARLPGLSTFTNTYNALYKHEKISFAGIKDTFVVESRAKSRSTVTEGRLPLLIGWFWCVIFFGAIIGVILYIIFN